MTQLSDSSHPIASPPSHLSSAAPHDRAAGRNQLLPLEGGALLEESNPGWIREISWGPLIIATAVPLHVAGVVLRQVMNRPVLVGTAMHVLAAVLVLTGTWILTARQPESKESGKSWHGILGWIARGCTLLVALLWVGLVVLTLVRPGDTTKLVIPALIFIAAETWATGRFAGQLAARIPHDGLANQFHAFAAFLPGLCGLLICCQFMRVGEYYAFFFISYPVIGGLAGFMIWLMVTLVRFTFALWGAARDTEAALQKQPQQGGPVLVKV